jgi:hypothetical protein
MKTVVINFYYSNTNRVFNFLPETKKLIDDGMTHIFTDGKDAQSKSTTGVFIFWDDIPVGNGLVDDTAGLS